MTRVKGYADWNPKQGTLIVLDAVQEVFETYQDNLPLTARQIFYRLVASYNYPKTEKDYKNLCNHLVRARRAGYIPWNYIRDDGTVEYGPTEYADLGAFWDQITKQGKNYQRLRQAKQEQYIEVWCEAAGMAPQLSRVCRDFGIDVFSTGGFSSVTVTHDVAERVARRDVPTVFLHIGDYDPSGASIYKTMDEDISAFVEYDTGSDEWFRAERVALKPDQIKHFNLEMAPPKASDSRTRNWIGETCQAEAMPPDVLAAELQAAIDYHWDYGVAEEIEIEEKIEREDLIPILAETAVDYDEFLYW